MHDYRQKMTFLTSSLSIGIIISFPFIAIETFEFDMYGTSNTAKILPPLMQVKGELYKCFFFDVIASG